MNCNEFLAPVFESNVQKEFEISNHDPNGCDLNLGNCKHADPILDINFQIEKPYDGVQLTELQNVTFNEPTEITCDSEFPIAKSLSTEFEKELPKSRNANNELTEIIRDSESKTVKSLPNEFEKKLPELRKATFDDDKEGTSEDDKEGTSEDDKEYQPSSESEDSESEGYMESEDNNEENNQENEVRKFFYRLRR